MGHGWKEASALVLCGGLGTMLASACDLRYTCETVEPGSAGAGYPTESVGAGDYLRDGEDEEVGSEAFELMAGCTPLNKCTEMFEKCQQKGYPCTRRVEGKKTMCAICQDNCWNGEPYKFRQCYDCGFY
ncbi:hypothetical protein [Sorangium sp. So ce1024]|uniref:hypothetical protein n=1 Tax=Sorangium sp. So ce1024 TaxID=3133327 RepID=UPI003F02BB03